VKSVYAVAMQHHSLAFQNVRRNGLSIVTGFLVLKDLSAANAVPSNRRLTESLKLRVLTLIRENYSDFGPTLAAEKLRERHNIRLSIETVRNWMTSDGLWVPHARRKSRVYQPRHRRDCLGNLSRSTAPTMTGLKAVRQNAACWSLSMMPPAV
jgi:hypothetical protein